jgi:isoleucyl-tRNA synthetase
LFENFNFTNVVKTETAVRSYWDKLDLLNRVKEKNQNGKRFVFYDGPITANNPMGVHHAWGRTYKDVVQRYYSLLGYHQRYQNGFDTQGLWLEVEVEKQLKMNSKRQVFDYGLDKFAQGCKDRIRKFADMQTNQSRNLGQMMDWDNSYYTHTDTNISYIWFFLKECHKRGWLYRGNKVMPWCTRCGTSLSNHEQSDSYRSMTHSAVYVKFKLLREDAYLLVWTTTPWTLPANVAVGVKPDADYGLFSNGNEKVYSRLGLKESLLKEYTLLETVKGQELEGLEYYLPVLENDRLVNSPTVYSWNDVSEEEGSGFVHLAPSCGQEDYEFGMKHELELVNLLDEEGFYLENFGKLSSKNYKEVNKLVTKYLERNNQLLHKEDYTHRYPVCWRCKEELVYRLVSEWFLNCDEIRPLMKVQAESVVWSPPHVGKLFQNWLDNMGDWCISRKRFWGLPLPFYDCQCGELTVVGSKTELSELSGVQVEDLPELHRPWVDELQVKCNKCGEMTKRVLEVGDCWLDAGIMPFSTLKYLEKTDYWEKWYPADYVCEMQEQVRLWFYSLMFMSVTLTGKSPYKFVQAYSKVNDKFGNAIHKTGKNAIVLDDALDVMGADVLRLMYLHQSVTTNMKFDMELRKQYVRPLNMIYNVVKFFDTFAKLDKYQFKEVSNNELSFLNKWVLKYLERILFEYHQYMQSYNFSDGLKLLERFLDDLSNWYVRRSRRKFWLKGDNTDKFEATTTLYKVLVTLVHYFAPFAPHFSELLYQTLKPYNSNSELSVHLKHFEKRFSPDNLEEKNSQTEVNSKDKSGNDPDLVLKEMALLRELTNMVLELRNQAKIKVRTPLSEVIVKSKKLESVVHKDEFLAEFRSEVNVKQVKLLENENWYLKYELSPNYSKLGPKLGSKVKQVNQYLKSLTKKDVYEFLQYQKQLQVPLDGFSETYDLSLDEVNVRTSPRKGFVATSQNDTVVFLNTKLTKEMRKEGLMRDFVRQVQELRKTLDLHVETQVVLEFVEYPEEFVNLVDEFFEMVQEENQVVQVKWNPKSELSGHSLKLNGYSLQINVLAE